MVTGPEHLFAGGAQNRVPLLVNILVIYEDTATGLRARQSVEALSRRLAMDADLGTRFWRLDLLRAEWFLEQVAFEAAAACVILLSLHGNEDLPLGVRGWLESWLRQKEDRAYALCVLLDPSGATQSSPNSAIVYLRQVAERAGADLFCSFNKPLGTGAEAVEPGDVGSVSHFAPAPAGDHTHVTPSSRWGINE